MKKTRVLIVDDSALIRELFTQLLRFEDSIEVVDTAVDAKDAREKIKRLNPDVVTLDVEMPGMDGISFLEKIMSLRPMPVVMVSKLTLKGASLTLRALELGAVDYIPKPTRKNDVTLLSGLKHELASKIKLAAESKVHFNKTTIANENQKPAIIPFTPTRESQGRVIAIGASTGGVDALREIMAVMPENAPPVLIAQHLPAAFTQSLANRLDSISAMHVTQAKDGEAILPGHAYLAPGGQQMEVEYQDSTLICRISQKLTPLLCQPSINLLFNSIARTVRSRAIGVILTGMGDDGATGLLEMKKSGAFTVGQNEQSCVIYGMPRAARLHGAVEVELPLGRIAKSVLQYCMTGISEAS